MNLLDLLEIYNLGGSHSFVESRFRNLGGHVTDIPLKKRREIMLEMIKGKCVK